MKKAKNPHRGSSFSSFLQKMGMEEEVTGRAAKKVLAWQLSQARGKK